MSEHLEFSDAALAELLRALRARSASHPDDPGLVVSSPAVRQERMPAACAELQRRGHAVRRVPGPDRGPARSPESWAIGVATEDPSWN